MSPHRRFHVESDSNSAANRAIHARAGQEARGMIRSFHLSPLTAFAVIAATVGVMVLAPVTAAATPTTFEVYMGDSCVNGWAKPSATLHLVWKSGSGVLKADRVFAVLDYGAWVYCAGARTVVQGGDQLKATIGGSTRTFIVPQLKAWTNRVTGVIRGTGPAGATLRVGCGMGWFPVPEPCINHKTVIVSRTGKWSVRWPSDGSDTHPVRWNDGAGDKVEVTTTTPFLTINLGRSTFEGSYIAGRTATVQVLDPSTSVVKASGSAVANVLSGSYKGTWRDASGDSYTIVPGDHIVSNIATSPDWVVPDIQATASASAQSVTGRCIAGWPVWSMEALLYRDGKQLDNVWIEPDDYDTGSFTVDWTREAGYSTLERGDKLMVMCSMGEHGDWAERAILVGD